MNSVHLPARGASLLNVPCCSCINLGFLQTTPGILKISQLLMGGICQTMMINFGTGQSTLLGMAYISLLTTVSASLYTTVLLLVCYLLSRPSFSLVRSSLFETLFNASAALSYLTSSAYLATVVNLVLYPIYVITLGFVAYPAMIGAYSLGFALSFIHGLDAYQCYKQYKGYG
ncbi:protein singles bar [Cimex lectularius]|uniref:MARVEL domain-containing protein n=1 Tax=Cimex lectularius TaxID=79782 RepID=A0A8I6SMN1_CIMLE|nr:protein singles bar [Cimex lectularius]XP_024084949.1 protein singles bar [Cimex lectularius]XP_024084950.1 protein singles bar [Cimex lectularius]